MNSTGRFTPELRRLINHSYDECRRCGATIATSGFALAGYDANGSPAYVGECCKSSLTELASHIYWSWHADRRSAPGQKLWRYMDLAKFMSLLEDKALFFARADKLGDPFEGAAGITERKHIWEENIIEQLRNAVITAPGRTIPLTEDEIDRDAKRLLSEMTQSLDYDRNHTFANCWHANSVESEALWRLYCPQPISGVVIQTTVEALELCFSPNSGIEIGKVNYIDFKTAFSRPYDRIFTKRKSLSHENEVRAVFFDYEIDDSCSGLSVPIDMSVLIQSIIISPYAPNWLLNLVERILRRYNINFVVRESELLSEPFF